MSDGMGWWPHPVSENNIINNKDDINNQDNQDNKIVDNNINNLVVECEIINNNQVIENEIINNNQVIENEIVNNNLYLQKVQSFLLTTCLWQVVNK